MTPALRFAIVCSAVAAGSVGYPCKGATATSSGPTPIDARQLLLKLSLKLRSTAPTLAESRAFEVALLDRPDDFDQIYGERLEAYIASAAFGETVESFHSVWWRLTPSETTRLARQVVVADRPYFELFERDYVVVDGATAARYELLGIKTAGPLPVDDGDWRTVRLDDDERRFRSVVGNLDFLDAYPDTPTNKNRKRASYILSTFLCETLAPSMPDPVPPPGDDPHGSSPDCVGCHYRLDPLARFFDRWRPPFPDSMATWYDIAQPAIGKLIVLADGGHRVHHGVTETELGTILASEPRVQSCVATKVWQMLLGPSVKLDRETETSLVGVFATRQSFKDLVRAVARHPYFWSTLEPAPLKFDDVKPSFQVCTACHSATGPVRPRFDPTVYPFVSDGNVALVKRIFGAVNHEPGFQPMPKSPAPDIPAQPLSIEALARIREWIVEGAFDNAGSATLSEAEIHEVLDDD